MLWPFLFHRRCRLASNPLGLSASPVHLTSSSHLQTAIGTLAWLKDSFERLESSLLVILPEKEGGGEKKEKQSNCEAAGISMAQVDKKDRWRFGYHGCFNWKKARLECFSCLIRLILYSLGANEASKQAFPPLRLGRAEGRKTCQLTGLSQIWLHCFRLLKHISS